MNFLLRDHTLPYRVLNERFIKIKFQYVIYRLYQNCVLLTRIKLFYVLITNYWLVHTSSGSKHSYVGKYFI